MFLVTVNGRMYNASMPRSVKPALIRRALDEGFWNVLETFKSVLAYKSKMKCLEGVSRTVLS